MPELEQPSQDNQNINTQAPVQPTRAEITERKKRRFIKYVKALVTLSIVIALIPVVWIAISTYISQNKPKVLIKDEETAPPIIETIPPTEDPLRTYTNEHFKFSFKYLKEDKLIAPAFVLGENQKIEVIFGKSLPAEDITEFNLADGYIFRIIPLVLSIQDINKIATIKQTTLKGVCPSTAEVTNISKALVGNIEGNMFEVLNCNVNFVIRYVLVEGQVYEITQVYKGDIGVKQVYKTKTEDILSSLDFEVTTKIEELSPYITHTATRHNIAFEYPRNFDLTCCIIATPPYSNPEKQIFGAQPTIDGSPIDPKNFKGFGIFLDPNPKQLVLEQYVQEEKQKLTDQYKIVKGVSPTGTDETVSVGNLTGTWLKGYTWHGENVFIAKIPLVNSVIVIYDTGLDSEILNTLLLSFKKNN